MPQFTDGKSGFFFAEPILAFSTLAYCRAGTKTANAVAAPQARHHALISGTAKPLPARP
jgi:hypothetical protein